MDPEEADPAKLGFDPFDVTKIWPRKQFPMQEFGKVGTLPTEVYGQY